MSIFRLATIIGLVLWSQLAASQLVDPSIQWKRWDLPHFELIYDARYQELADLYAPRLEWAAEHLSPLYQEGVAKTVVVLNDGTDLTNGFATVLPYPMIQSFPVLPASQDSIGDYGDWAAELVTHEYTHILALHQQRGVPLALSYFFGSIMSPNVLLPRWWHEGLAVEAETQFSADGRLRSPEQDAWIRSLALDQTLLSMTVAEANEVNLPTWPYGARPYLFGSLFWSQVIADKGWNAARDLAWAHAGRMPYFINAPAEEILGRNYVDEFNLSLQETLSRARNQLGKLQQGPALASHPVALTDLEVMAPAISPDHLKMVVIGKDETSRRSLRIMERPNPKTPFTAEHLLQSSSGRLGESSTETRAPVPHEHLNWLTPDLSGDEPPAGTMSRASWFPDSQRLIYDRVEVFDRFHQISDLWVYDLKTEKTERLTHGLRGREPAVSPDGKEVIYVKLDAGRTSLEAYDLSQKKSRRLYTGSLQDRCSQPEFIDAQHVLFLLHHGGHDQVQILNIKTKNIRTLGLKVWHAAHLEKRHLSYVGLNNGVPNVYQSDWPDFNKDPQVTRPVTNSLTGIMDATWDESQNDYYLSQQSSSGLKLVRVPGTLVAANGSNLPVVQPLFEDRQNNPVTEERLPTTPVPPNTTATEYSAWPYMAPHYWIPLWTYDSYSNYLVASTAGADPLGKHAYSVTGLYDLQYGRGGYSAGYVDNTWPWQFDAVITDTTVELPGTIPERNQIGHLQLDDEITSISPFLYLSPGWTWFNRSLGGFGTTQNGPSLQTSYANFLKQGAQISPESGWGGTATATSYLGSGSNLNYNQYELSGVKYFSQIFPKRHSLMLKYQGIWADQNIPSTNYASTVSIPTYADTYFPQYLMRAYPTGAFQGRLLENINLEYRFPINNESSGHGTWPIFLRRWHGALVADGVNVDGFAYNSQSQLYQVAKTTQSFWDIGGEIRGDTTIGYQVPLTFYMGYYVPLEQSLNNSGNFGLGILFQ